MFLFNKQSLKSSIFYLILVSILTYFIMQKNILTTEGSWLLSINLVLFILMGKDKFSAIINIGRIPEGTLLWLGFLGAFPALLFARLVFNHKTSKEEFIKAMLVLLFLQIGLLIYYFYKYGVLFEVFVKA